MKTVSVTGPQEQLTLPSGDGGSIVAEARVWLVSQFIEVDSDQHFLIQEGCRNGTEVCGEVIRILDDEGFVCRVDEVTDELNVETESDIRPEIGSTVRFSGELTTSIEQVGSGNPLPAQ